MKSSTVVEKISKCLYKIGVANFVIAVRTDDAIDSLSVAVSGDFGLFALTARHLDRAVDEAINDVYARKGGPK